MSGFSSNSSGCDERMVEKIKRARTLALRVLQPTNRDLERGLELHANSIVCDTYGFAPQSAIDGERVVEMVTSGASDSELLDFMTTMRMIRCVSDPVERAEYESAWRASGVTCVFQNAGVESQAPMRIIKRLARFTYVVDNLRDLFVRATQPNDIVAAKSVGKHCLYMSSNGVPLSEEWVSVAEELRYIEVFHQLGMRMMHLTYNRRNMVGDGCGEVTNAGLSDFGRSVIAKMNSVGLLVDTAHSGHQTSLEAAKLSEYPVVASHSGCTSLNDHIRCKPDDVIRAIADGGGYIGICCIPEFLGGSGDIRAMLDHIDHVVKRFGPDYVSIGTDVPYVSTQAEIENQKVPRRRRARSPWEKLWPSGSRGYATTEQAESMAWTNWPLFTVGMVQRGYSDEVIQKIIGGNMLRVIRAVHK